MRYAVLLISSALIVSLAGLAAAQNGVAPGTQIPGITLPNGITPGINSANRLQVQQQLQQLRQQQLQGTGTMTAAEAAALQRMLMSANRSGGVQTPVLGNSAQQAYLQQRQALAAAEAAKKAERRERIRQSILMQKQKEAAKAAGK